jgi:hypothetical protein
MDLSPIDKKEFKIEHKQPVIPVNRFESFTKLYESITEKEAKYPGFFEIVFFLIKHIPTFLVLIYKLLTLGNVKMKDLKTTLTVIIGAIAFLVNRFFGINIPEEAIVMVVVFFVGIFSKDSEPTK